MRFILAALALSLVTTSAAADDKPTTYDLKYRFTKGETIRTKVTHTSAVHTTIKGSHESATSTAESEKVWEVFQVTPSGEASFVYSVEYVVMRGKVGDLAEVVYDSRKDAIVPEVYRGIAKTVRTPIAEISLDARGRMSKRLVRLQDEPANVSGGSVTISFPIEPIAVGHAWHEDFTIPVQVDGAAGRKVSRDIKARQKFKLESVTDGVARVSVVTQVIELALPAAIEVQLVQRLLEGEVRFDIARGRIVSQKMKVDGNVIDFHGAGSLMKCKMTIEEELTSAKLEMAKLEKGAAKGGAKK